MTHRPCLAAHRPERALFVALAAIGAGLAAFAVGSAAAAEPTLATFGAAGAAPQAPWKVVGLPQQTKPFTKFSVVDIDGRRGVKIEADESYGNIVHLVKMDPPAHLAWHWRVEQAIEGADLRQRGGDDNAVKVCVFFDVPIDSVSFADRQLLRMARGKTADFVPTATVCYVWDPHLAVGTTLENAFTKRVRYLVLESGSDKLNRWVTERRDLAADFTKLFGSESPTVPAILGVAVGADADNTKSHSISYVGGVVLEP